MNKEEKTFLTKEEALRIANINDNQIHNFISVSFGLIGADYDIKTFNEYLEKASSIEVGGSQCRNMNHAIAIIKDNEVYFFEHKEEELKKLLKEKGINE